MENATSELKQLLEVMEQKGISVAEMIECIKDREPKVITMKIGGRIYNVISFLRENEISVTHETMTTRAKEMRASIGKDDGQYLLDHQDDIPIFLRERIVFTFPDWRHPQIPKRYCLLIWRNGQWAQKWNGHNDFRSGEYDRFICREEKK